MKPVPIGVDSFRDLITENYYYVDKTKVIEEILYNKNKVVLFPRPRRFGKTLLLSMMDSFFNIDKKEKELFKGLYIGNSVYMEECGKYPVIHIDFKELKRNTYKEVMNQFKIMMSKLYAEKSYVKEILDKEEKQKFELIKGELGTKDDYIQAINLLSLWLSRYHKERVIILMDEYDAPITNSYINNIYEEVMSFIRGVFSSSLKGNENLKMGILTGITRVSKESVFSGFNNPLIFDIMSEQYNEYFGFTEKETKELLKYYGLELTKNIKEYYNGYNFGGTAIYNPWSILNYTFHKKITPYWFNTSDNALIKQILKETSEENKIEIEKLILGESITFSYNNMITFQDLQNNIENGEVIFNLLLASGYLTYDKTITSEITKKNRDYFKIPNKEVKEEFIKIVKNINHQHIIIEKEENFALSILNNEREKIEKYLNDTLLSVSYHDTKEMFYHGYMLGLFQIFIGSEYIVKSNREAGVGRYDLLIEKVDRSIGMIIEIKIANTKEEMEKEAEIALNQIKEKEYYQELVLDKVEQILEYAIVFYEKSCIVRN